MSDMNLAQLRRLDMTLLLVFDAALRHRKLTAVAFELGLSQSAISHTLNRLRDIFDDELFLRRPSGVEPTARALSLEPEIARILDLTAQALKSEKKFEPRTDRRLIRMGAQEYVTTVIGGGINGLMGRKAPHMRVLIESGTSRELFDGVMTNTLDFVVTSHHNIPAPFIRHKLYDETYVVAARKTNPLIGTRLTLAAYLRAEHVLVSNAPAATGRLETGFAAAGITRNVVMTMPFFLSALAATKTCDRILTLPKSLAKNYAEAFGLNIFALPVKLPKYPVYLVYHPRSERDPALTWFRSEIIGFVERR